MTRGSTHEVVGRLNELKGRWSLRVEGGGEWRLDLGWRVHLRARRLLDHRVIVAGVREGFYLLLVRRIEAAEL